MAETKNKKPISDRSIPSISAKFSEEEKRMLIEGTDKSGRELSPAEKMKLSKMHTERTIGSDWRERGAERLAATESARAQQALDERRALNMAMTPTEITIPKKADEWQDVTGGGKVKIGDKTLANMRKFEEDKASADLARKEKQKEKFNAFAAQKYGALQKRYEDELMSRGFTPPKTREEENIYNRQRMEEFRLAEKYRTKAEETEKRSFQEYSSLKKAEREAKKNKDYTTASYLQNQANAINDAAGGNIQNQSARKKFFADQANTTLMNELKARADARKAVIQKQTTSNPEASSFTPTNREMGISGTAPIGVGTDIPSYQLSYKKPSGPLEQGFGMTIPSTTDRGVDFSSISESNFSSSTSNADTGSTAQPSAPNKTAITFPTSKDQNIESVLPGISEMPVVARNPNETPAQHNARVMKEYENNVIIPSFDEDTQNAFLSASELNKKIESLKGQRYASPKKVKEYKELTSAAKEQQDILKGSIDKLRPKLRDLNNYPMNSEKRKLIELQIATLKNQLGTFAKKLY